MSIRILHAYLKFHNVSLLHYVIFPLYLYKAFLSASQPPIFCHEIFKFHYVCFYEFLFKIGVNNASCLWCQCPLRNCPGPCFYFTSSEKRYKSQSFVRLSTQTF